MSSDGQQQQQAPDIGAIITGMSQDNRNVMERKGFLKDGKPVEGFTFDKIVDSYRGLETLQGKKTLEEPNPADPDAFAVWPGHKILGVPEKPDDYKFDKPALPNGLKWSEAEGDGGIPWDAAGEKMLRTALLKGKVGQTQASEIIKEIVTARIGGIVQSQADATNQKSIVQANLQKDFGVALKGALETGKQAIEHIAGLAKIDAKGLISAIEKTDGPEAALRFSIQLGKMLGEDTLKGGKEIGFATSPDSAKSQIAAFEADAEKTKALMNKDNPRHKQVNEEWQRLHAILRAAS